MNTVLFLLLLSLGARPAAAYSPETLLGKSIAHLPEIPEPGPNQFLNPFSKVELGFEHGWSHEKGSESPDTKSRLNWRDSKSKGNEITLGLRPKSLREMREYKRFSQALRGNAADTRRLLLSQTLRGAYELLALAAAAQEEVRLIADWQKLLEKSLRLSSIQARSSEGEAKTLLKANLEIDKARGEQIEINARVAMAEAGLARYGLKLAELEADDLLTAQAIQERIEKLPAGNGLTQTELGSALAVAQAGLAYSMAERGRLIDGLKFSVGRSRDDTSNSRFDPDPSEATWSSTFDRRHSTSYKLSISLNLPFLAAQDLDEQKDSIKVARLEVETQIEKREADAEQAEMFALLKHKTAHYLSLSDTGLLSAKPSAALLGQDPALALDLERLVMGRRLLKSRLLAEIRTLYVGLLMERGVFAADPGVNHLSLTGRKI